MCEARGECEGVDKDYNPPGIDEDEDDLDESEVEEET